MTSMMMDLDRAYRAMPDQLELNVTPGDITKGERENPLKCALALAANRELAPYFPGEKVKARIEGSSLKIIGGAWSVGRYWLPPVTWGMMHRFDAKRKVKPGKYPVYKPGTHLHEAGIL